MGGQMRLPARFPKRAELGLEMIYTTCIEVMGFRRDGASGRIFCPKGNSQCKPGDSGEAER